MATTEQLVEEFLKKSVLEIRPDTDLSQGSATYDLMIKPTTRIVSPVIRSVEALHSKMSIRNAPFLSELDMDDLMANFFLFRRVGSKATGEIRLYFREAIDFTVTENQVRVQNNLSVIFSNPFPFSITAFEMSANFEDQLYFVDLYVESEEFGFFPTLAGDIRGFVNNGTAAISVQNLNDFFPGSARENNIQFAERGELAITVRNLINKRSIPTVLKENFGWIKSVDVVGYGHQAMKRDIINLSEIINILNSSPNLNTPVEVPNFISPEKFHIGNKIDIYINQKSLRSHSVTLTQDETSFFDASIYPGGGNNMELDLSLLIDESGNQRFNFPIYEITSIQVLNSLGEAITLSDEILEEPLETAVNPSGFLSGMYSYFTRSPELSFSSKEKILLKLKSDRDTDGSTIPGKTTLQGQPIRINYTYFDGIKEVQDFVSSSDDRVVSCDPLVFGMTTAVVDYYDDSDSLNIQTSLSVRLAPGKSVADVENDIAVFFENLQGSFEVSDLVAFLYLNQSVSYVKQPMYFRIKIINKDRVEETYKPLPNNPELLSSFSFSSGQENTLLFISKVTVREI